MTGGPIRRYALHAGDWYNGSLLGTRISVVDGLVLVVCGILRRQREDNADDRGRRFDSDRRLHRTV